MMSVEKVGLVVGVAVGAVGVAVAALAERRSADPRLKHALE